MNSREKPFVLGVTLARGGSKRIPGKNIRPLAGLPLLAHTVREALKVEEIDRYIVSTDDFAIQAVATCHGADAPFIRPATLSQDDTTSVAALQHAVSWVESAEERRVDFVVELMATNPLKNSVDIKQCIQLVLESGAPSVIAMAPVGEAHPARVKKIVDGLVQDFAVPEVPESRRQDLQPEAFVRAGSIYAMARDELMVRGRRYRSGVSMAYLLPEERTINLDTERDWLMAEILIQDQRYE